jgi:hypothetical protein
MKRISGSEATRKRIAELMSIEGYDVSAAKVCDLMRRVNMSFFT